MPAPSHTLKKAEVHMTPRRGHAKTPSFPCLAIRKNTSDDALSSLESFLASSQSSTSHEGSAVSDAPEDSKTGVHIFPISPHHVRGGSISSNESSSSAGKDQVVPFQECPSTMLVPLVHRHLEMQMLINRNPSQFNALKAAISSADWDKCIQLWTKVPRDEMNDAQWLKQSKTLITARDTIGHKRFWIDWCGVTGWDPRDIIPVELESIATGINSEVNRQEPVLLSSPSHSVHSVLADTVEEEPEL
jgi:hypothetical protein